MVSIYLTDMGAAISPLVWQNAVDGANRNQRPPEPHLLLRDARARRNREHYKYSAIYSAIAAEVTIKDEIQVVLRGHGNPEAFIKGILKGTLGRLEGHCKELGIGLPDDFHKHVTETRNRAMHKNETIDRNQASNALNVAQAVLEMYAPVG